MKKKVLFLCTHNSARSQMAEGLLRHTAADRFEVFSAGTEETRVNPFAIEAMSEIGIDITSHSSKTLDRYLDEAIDYVVTVCDNANESCPVFPHAVERIHWSFEDPSLATGSHGECLAEFCRIRDQIAEKLRFFESVW